MIVNDRYIYSIQNVINYYANIPNQNYRFNLQRIVLDKLLKIQKQVGLSIKTVYQYVINDKTWQSTYRKNKFNKNLRYITTVINKMRSKISRATIAKESILKIWRFKYSDFISK